MGPPLGVQVLGQEPLQSVAQEALSSLGLAVAVRKVAVGGKAAAEDNLVAGHIPVEVHSLLVEPGTDQVLPQEEVLPPPETVGVGFGR